MLFTLCCHWRNLDAYRESRMKSYRRQKEQKSRGTRQKNFSQLLQ